LAFGLQQRKQRSLEREYRMEELAEAIRRDLSQLEANASQWVDVTLTLAQHLAEARGKLKQDKDFHEWLGVHKLYLNAKDREALLHMAKEPELARKILQQTKRRSYQLIWRREMMPNSRLVRANQPDGSKTNKTEQKEPNYKPSSGPETLDAEPLVFDLVRMKPEEYTEHIYATTDNIRKQLDDKKYRGDTTARQYFKLGIGIGIVATSELNEAEIDFANAILKKRGFMLVPCRADDFEDAEQKQAESVD
jgi:hypothetical protein